MKRAIFYAILAVAVLALAHPLWRLFTEGVRWECVANTLTMTFLLGVTIFTLRSLRAPRVSMVVTTIVLLRVVFSLTVGGMLCWYLFLAAPHLAKDLGAVDSDYYVLAFPRPALFAAAESLLEVVTMSVGCAFLIRDWRRMRRAGLLVE